MPLSVINYKLATIENGLLDKLRLHNILDTKFTIFQFKIRLPRGDETLLK